MVKKGALRYDDMKINMVMASVLDFVTREEYNRFLARVAGCKIQWKKHQLISENIYPSKILRSLEKELEKYKQYVAIGYNYFYKGK